MRRLIYGALICGFFIAPGMARAAILINEFAYDDTGSGTDQAEFVELYNSDLVNSVDIGGWTLIGHDSAAAPNPSIVVPAATMIAPGGYYVFGNAAVGPKNLLIAPNFLENDTESIEILDAGGVMQDAVVYESSPGLTGTLATLGIPAQAGGGIYGNNQFQDTPVDGSGMLVGSLGRFINGRDTNVNGRDFGVRRFTPGASNGGVIAHYEAPNVSGDATGSTVPGYGAGFVQPRVIDPGVVDANNENVIPPPPGGTKAIIGWDPSGGGNGIAYGEAMDGDMSYDIHAYFDTNNIPLNTNTAGTAFRGAEITQFGLGGADSLTNLSNVSGTSGGLAGGTTALNGATGVFWHYEKVGETSLGANDVSEKLFLIDAGAGGDSNVAGGMAWTVLEEIDMSTLPSDWYRLQIRVDASGAGVARFGDQVFVFSTAANQTGSFFAGYRENTQAGSNGTPSYIRPPTWAAVPEPGALALLAIGLFGCFGAATRRR